jgi:anti-sigma B factor antagonist
MEFYYDDVDRDVLILKADGGIDSTNAEEVVAELTRLVESGIRKLVVDCTGLGYISSTGVGVLVRLHKTLGSVGGQAKVASVRGPVFRLLELTKLAELFEIYPSVEDALAAFRKSA